MRFKSQFRVLKHFWTVRRGEGVNATNDIGETYLHFAAFHSRPDLVKWLIDKGAECNMQACTCCMLAWYSVQIVPALESNCPVTVERILCSGRTKKGGQRWRAVQAAGTTLVCACC